MSAIKTVKSPMKDIYMAATPSPTDNSTTLELLGLLTAAQFYAKKLESEKGETRVNYVKMIDMLVAYLRKDLG